MHKNSEYLWNKVDAVAFFVQIPVSLEVHGMQLKIIYFDQLFTKSGKTLMFFSQRCMKTVKM